jgi:hypothetical protein
LADLGCWNFYWDRGTYALGGLYGYVDITWCGERDTGWVRHTWASCNGHDGGYPGYEYLGCNNSEQYGVNWNAWDVRTQWYLCPVWNPIWGSCVSSSSPWNKWRFHGTGAITSLGAG